MNWKEQYDKKNRPLIKEIQQYLTASALEAFTEFNKILLEKYNLGYVRPVYSYNDGWKYSYGRSGYILVNQVCFHDNRFSVEGIEINDKTDLTKAIHKVDEMFHDGFLIRYAEFDEKRTARRKLKQQLNKKQDIKTENTNDLVWPKKVSRQDLKRLYQSDARMMLDEELLEEIGLTLCLRCKEAKEIYDLMEMYKIKCMHCGEILSYGNTIICSCGKQYTYHTYRKGYRENNMPRGAASEIFDQFVEDWMSARFANEKMGLIDNLIHSFHIAIISGSKGRPVGINLIQGTKKQIVELIEELAN